LHIDYSTDGDKSKTTIRYKGRATPNEMDRAFLSIITTLVTQREMELKKIGLSKTDMTISGTPDDDSEDYSDLLKR